MSLIDLTCTFPKKTADSIRLREIPLSSVNTRYTGMVYDLTVNSMDGSYVDFPGHIKETADGFTAETMPQESFFRIPCSVIHLNRTSGSGAVGAEELEKSFGGKVDTPAVIINALGSLEPYEIVERSVYLDFSALDWLIQSGIRILVSDIYESRSLDGVFLKLFGAGISTVCEPRHLSLLKGHKVLLSINYLPIPRLTQVPCRILAETWS